MALMKGYEKAAADKQSPEKTNIILYISSPMSFPIK
jgi:hypothetical protein